MEDNNASTDLPQPVPLLEYGNLRVIFNYLNLRDLLSATAVCFNWKKVGEIVRRQRENRLGIFIHHPYPIENTRQAVELSNGFKLTDSTISWRNKIKRKKDPDIKSFELSLWNYIRNQYSEPAQLVCFANSDVADFTTRRRFKTIPNVDLFKRVQKVVPCVCAFARGIILTLPDNNLCLENECRSGHRVSIPMIAGLVIPKIQGLKIETFEWKRDIRIPAEEIPKRFTEILNIDPSDDVKGIILFQNFRAPSFIFEENQANNDVLLIAVHEFLKKNPKTAFGGGLFSNSSRSGTTEDNLIACGFVISGGPNIKVGSVAFEDPGISERNITNLQKLKGMCDPRSDQSFAFMFSCTGRGIQMHKAEHVESTLFRSEFRNTPLIGAFTNGEYLHSFVPGQATEPKVVEHASGLTYGYSTVFVYVSYGNANI